MWELVGPLISVHRLVLFFPDVYRFSDPSVHPVAFSVNLLGAVQVYDVVERDGMVCDYQLPHIYDDLLSAATTPGGQSFRQKHQRLPKSQQKQYI